MTDTPKATALTDKQIIERLAEHYYTKAEENAFRDAVINHLITVPFVDGSKRTSRESWYEMCNALRSHFLK